MSPYRVFLEFRPGVPAVTGEWTDADVAHRTYRSWVGLYGSRPQVVIRLVEQAPDGPRVVKSWTAADGEVEPPPAP